MNEEALQYSFDLFVNDGYNGDFDQYKKLIEEDEEALNYSFELFSKDGYEGDQEKFTELVGVGKPLGVVAEDATVTSEPKASESMVSDLETPSLELEEKELTSWQSIKNSLLNVGETIGDVAEFWFDPSGDGSGSRAALDIATNTIASYMFGQEDINKYVEKVGKDSSLAAGLGTESTLESINKLEEERAQTLQTKGIRESAKKGDIGGVIMLLITMLLFLS